MIFPGPKSPALGATSDTGLARRFTRSCRDLQPLGHLVHSRNLKYGIPKLVQEANAFVANGITETGSQNWNAVLWHFSTKSSHDNRRRSLTTSLPDYSFGNVSKWETNKKWFQFALGLPFNKPKTGTEIQKNERMFILYPQLIRERGSKMVCSSPPPRPPAPLARGKRHGYIYIYIKRDI